MATYQGERQLDALGDPSRRAIISVLAGGPFPVGMLADRLPISRPAVSQHLRVLEAAELVRVEVRGTRRMYSLDTAGVAQVRSFLDAFWREDLEQFASYVQEQITNAEETRNR